MVKGLYRLFAKDRDLAQGGDTLVNITDFVEWHENSGLVIPGAGNGVTSSVRRDRGTLQRENATSTQNWPSPTSPHLLPLITATRVRPGPPGPWENTSHSQALSPDGGG